MKMNESRIAKKDKKQHIQVFARVRPLNNTEKAGKSMIVVDTPSNKEIIVRERPRDKFTKKFTFDKVFGSYSKQLEVYNAVVSPLVAEVLAGYNCTVFAYGQTGSGKTFTMEGFDNNPLLQWQADSSAGIVPRASSHLFDELRAGGTLEYTVRVSFLELYNEEIYDLLSPSDDAAKIRIYEDSTKKGAVIVHGLEEVIIHNKSEIFKILQKGSEKRQTAATLMNAHSSRSHTIFSITVHIKENNIDGEELLKTGKLNLVDLAGSENIGRSGAVDKRAREAGSINQSLLTLGRVITALVEKTPHVPYRESKLTRLLQESLGGRTRTSIIATVSPASINLEETLSTLDYAHRAKNITNRPEINQKFSKKALLQEYTEEIEKLKKDLLASRERNGVYLAPDSYSEMQSLISFQSKEIGEKLNHIKALEDTLNYKEQIFNELKSESSARAIELLNVKNQLATTTKDLMLAASHLVISEQEKEEQKHLVEKHTSTENILVSEVQTVLDVADTAATDVHKLHDKIFRKTQIGQRNSCLGQQFKNDIKRQIKDIEVDISTHNEDVVQFYASMKDHIDAETSRLSECIDKSVQDIFGKIVNPTQNITSNLTKNINDSNLKYQQILENEIQNVTTITEQECNILNNVCSKIAQQIQQLIDNNIAKNLRALENDISEKIDNFTECTQNMIMSISKYSAEKRDQLNSKIQNVKENVEDIHQSQNIIMEKRRNFAKLMVDLQRCFNEMQDEEEDDHVSICDTLSNIDEVCNVINNENSNTCEINTEKDNDLQEKLQHDLEIVRQTISEDTGKSRIEAENAIVKSKALITEFQVDLSNNCDTLTNFQNCVERNIRKIQNKMQEDKNHILLSINEVYTIVYSTCIEHITSLDSCKVAFLNITAEMKQKLESEAMDIENINSRIVIEMQAIRDRIDKFFIEDLYRDVSTGSTPAKKTFQFCKKLVRTSPHARILERYRQTFNDIDDIEDKPISQLNNNSIEEIEETLCAD